MFNYPIYNPDYGNLTKIIMNEYINYNIKNNSMPIDSHNITQITSLVASNNKSDKLYFWQLYSILGEFPIKNLITVFYTRIFNDVRNDWFRNEFIELGNLEHHITGQTNFWLDIMGGGKRYFKKEKSLYYKHKQAEDIMTEKGSNRWMKHMINSLYEVNLCQLNDKRVIPCISDFLYYFMQKYSHEFDFNFYEKINVISKL